MNFVRQFLAVFLSLFLASPAWAAEKKSEGQAKYPYFKLGIRSVNPSGEVDWSKECVVVTSEDSVPVRLEYKSSVDGKIKVSVHGIVRPGEEIIVDKETKRAVRVRKCGNGVFEPKDWIPVGELKCGVVKKVVTEPVATFEPLSLTSPGYGWGIKPGGEKPLDLELEDPAPAPSPVTTKAVDKGKKKSKAWWYIAGGVILGGAIVALAGGGGSKKSSGGGPAPDPKN